MLISNSRMIRMEIRTTTKEVWEAKVAAILIAK